MVEIRSEALDAACSASCFCRCRIASSSRNFAELVESRPVCLVVSVTVDSVVLTEELSVT